jgi:hypothetical protein
MRWQSFKPTKKPSHFPVTSMFIVRVKYFFRCYIVFILKVSLNNQITKMSPTFPWQSVSTVLSMEIVSQATKNKKQNTVLLNKTCHENMWCLPKALIVYIIMYHTCNITKIYIHRTTNNTTTQAEWGTYSQRGIHDNYTNILVNYTVTNTNAPMQINQKKGTSNHVIWMKEQCPQARYWNFN